MLRLKKRKSLTGFTLIELLVVIAIIGLLAAIILVSVNNARGKARDVRRKADLAQVYTALMLYYDDHGYLPVTSSYGENGPGGWDYSSQDINGNGQYFLEFLEPKYLPKSPVDPVNNGVGDVHYGGAGFAYSYYCYDNSLTCSPPGSDCILLGARLENGNLYYYSYEGGNRLPTTCQ